MLKLSVIILSVIILGANVISVFTLTVIILSLFLMSWDHEISCGVCFSLQILAFYNTLNWPGATLAVKVTASAKNIRLGWKCSINDKVNVDLEKVHVFNCLKSPKFYSKINIYKHYFKSILKRCQPLLL